jgi:DNA-binding response OmpR family regulator
VRDPTASGPDDEAVDDVDTAGVELVRWPEQRTLRDRFARDGIPRLLLVAPGAEPPRSLAFDEGWLRRPVVESDLRARARQLARTVAMIERAPPWIDERDQLHRGPNVVRLTPAEAAVARALLSAPGTVVERDALRQRLWPTADAPSLKAVDAVVYRLRRRVGAMHLHIRTVRSRGFVLDL